MPKPTRPVYIDVEELNRERELSRRRREIKKAQDSAKNDKIFEKAKPVDPGKILERFGDVSDLQDFYFRDKEGNTVRLHNGELAESETKDGVHFEYYSGKEFRDIPSGQVKEKSMPNFKAVRYWATGEIRDEVFDSGDNIYGEGRGIIGKGRYSAEDSGDYFDMKTMVEQLGEHPTFADVRKYIGQKIDAREENSGHAPVLSAAERSMMRRLTKDNRSK